jgi:hypothetical protein
MIVPLLLLSNDEEVIDTKPNLIIPNLAEQGPEFGSTEPRGNATANA